MSLILLILIFIRPFISSLAFPYLNSIYSVFLIGFLLIWIIVKGISLEKVKTLRYPLILLCLALTISIIFSTNRINSFTEIYKYISGLLMLLVASFLPSEDRMRVIRSITSAGLVISLLAIYQYLFGFQHILNYMAKFNIADTFALDYVQQKRAFFPFITPNTLAGYLIMLIPLTLIHKNSIWFTIPLSLALLLTKSLGAFLSIFLALSIYFYLQDELEKRKLFFLLGILVIIGLVFITRSVTQKEHLKPVFSTVMRLNYWRETVEIIKRHPFSGVGIGNFDLVQSRFAHNSYLQIWAEMGILAIAGLIWIIFNSFKTGFKKLEAEVLKSKKHVIAGLLAANSAFLIHNFIDFSFFLPETSTIWWIILGLIISADNAQC